MNGGWEWRDDAEIPGLLDQGFAPVRFASSRGTLETNADELAVLHPRSVGTSSGSRIRPRFVLVPDHLSGNASAGLPVINELRERIGADLNSLMARLAAREELALRFNAARQEGLRAVAATRFLDIGGGFSLDLEAFAGMEDLKQDKIAQAKAFGADLSLIIENAEEIDIPGIFATQAGKFDQNLLDAAQAQAEAALSLPQQVERARNDPRFRGRLVGGIILALLAERLVANVVDGGGPRRAGGANVPERLFTPSGNPIPFGFRSADEFGQFSARLKSGLPEGSHAVFQGSAVTGRSSRTGAIFDIGRTSDLDIGITGTLFDRAGELGLRVKTQPSRIGPLNDDALRSLGLSGLRDQLSGQAGRPVNILLFDTLDSALQRPSIYVP